VIKVSIKATNFDSTQRFENCHNVNEVNFVDLFFVFSFCPALDFGFLHKCLVLIRGFPLRTKTSAWTLSLHLEASFNEIKTKQQTQEDRKKMWQNTARHFDPMQIFIDKYVCKGFENWYSHFIFYVWLDYLGL
jgi:hypothetical protein